MSLALVTATFGTPDLVGRWWTSQLVDEGRRPIRIEYGHPLAILQYQRAFGQHPDADPQQGRNFAVTLPDLKGRIRVCTAQPWISPYHLTHEAVGHGRQIVAMGVLDYSATYGYHFVILKRGPVTHLMERDAEKAERLHTAAFYAEFRRVFDGRLTPGLWTPESEALL